MYFASRLQAGRILAKQMAGKYRYENCAVVALDDGGVIIGAEVASCLHCILTILQTETINLPRETHSIAGLTEDGSFSYNNAYSSGEIDEMVGEYYHYIEQEKLEKLHKMHGLIGGDGLVSPRLLKGRDVILVSDGLKDGFKLDIALQFLKPIATNKLVVATPLASVAAVDRMHVIADDLYCLSVVEDYISTEHYYNQQDVPDHNTIIKTINQVILNWK